MGTRPTKHDLLWPFCYLNILEWLLIHIVNFFLNIITFCFFDILFDNFSTIFNSFMTFDLLEAFYTILFLLFPICCASRHALFFIIKQFFWSAFCWFWFERNDYFSFQISPTIEDPEVFKDIETHAEKALRYREDWVDLSDDEESPIDSCKTNWTKPMGIQRRPSPGSSASIFLKEWHHYLRVIWMISNCFYYQWAEPHTFLLNDK